MTSLMFEWTDPLSDSNDKHGGLFYQYHYSTFLFSLILNMSGFFLCIKEDPQLDVDVLWQSPCVNKTRKDAVFFLRETHKYPWNRFCVILFTQNKWAKHFSIPSFWIVSKQDNAVKCKPEIDMYILIKTWICFQ